MEAVSEVRVKESNFVTFRRLKLVESITYGHHNLPLTPPLLRIVESWFGGVRGLVVHSHYFAVILLLFSGDGWEGGGSVVIWECLQQWFAGETRGFSLLINGIFMATPRFHLVVLIACSPPPLPFSIGANYGGFVLSLLFSVTTMGCHFKATFLGGIKMFNSSQCLSL